MLQVSADESTDRGGTLKFLFTIVDLHEFGRAVQPLGRCGVQASNPACAGWSLFHHPVEWKRDHEPLSYSLPGLLPGAVARLFRQL